MEFDMHYIKYNNKIALLETRQDVIKLHKTLNDSEKESFRILRNQCSRNVRYCIGGAYDGDDMDSIDCMAASPLTCNFLI